MTHSSLTPFLTTLAHPSSLRRVLLASLRYGRASAYYRRRSALYQFISTTKFNGHAECIRYGVSQYNCFYFFIKIIHITFLHTLKPQTPIIYYLYLSCGVLKFAIIYYNLTFYRSLNPFWQFPESLFKIFRVCH